MRERHDVTNGAPVPRRALPAMRMFWLGVGLTGLAGCSLTPLAKHTAAFSTATASVVNGSEDAYKKANSLYFEEQSSAAVLLYDKSPTWDPHSIKPLLTPRQLQVRQTLLDGLKAYAESLDRIENVPRSAQGLDTASAGIGNSLLALTANVNTDFADTGFTGITLTQAKANDVSTAAYALGEFLLAHKVKSDLPRQIERMDPTVSSLCKVLEIDIATLQQQADNSYSNLLTQQDVFIRTSHGLSAEERRTEIAKLPRILQRSQASHDLLEGLKGSIKQLEQTHHSLAAVAEGGEPLTLEARIAALLAAGKNLEAFYATLPAS